MAYFLFLAGLFLIPFESLPITISPGWNAIAYLPFLLSFLLLFKQPLYSALLAKVWQSSACKKISLVATLLAATTLIGYAIYGLPPIRDLAEGLIKVFLLCMLASLFLYFNTFLKRDIARQLLFLASAYSVSLLVGVLSRFGTVVPLLANYRGGIDSLGNGKNPFTFSEPSFAGPHLIFVLLMLYISFDIRRSPGWKCLALVYTLFILFVVYDASALRPVIDSALSILLLVIFRARRYLSVILATPGKISKWSLLLISSALALFIIVAFAASQDSARLSGLLTRIEFIDRDPSSMIRRLRVEIPLNSISSDFQIAVSGAGFSNLCNMTRALPGIDQYSSLLSRFPEFQSILLQGCIDQSYSGHVFLLGSFGCLGYFLILWSLYNKQLVPIALLLVLVLFQFESPAYYGVGVYLWKHFESRLRDRVIA